ncbi:hypothetical protein BVRB_2g045820 isoform A [Beta vulgaris subsp. vulgaris]|nr:hypothetical protein BVRB_2g045820 isoform A [Beta vulgaris subsp. vulgaris]
MDARMWCHHNHFICTRFPTMHLQYEVDQLPTPSCCPRVVVAPKLLPPSCSSARVLKDST